MTTVEIIMQQKRIAAEKEKAEKKLAYDTIKEWAEKNVNTFANKILQNIAKKFAEGKCDKVIYSCSSGFCNHILGNEYPENIGANWNVVYFKNHILADEYRLAFIDYFFESSPIEKNVFSINYVKAFISHLLLHTALPELLRNEGFVVEQTGCGCCEKIEVSLPEF